jgi:putative adhesin
MTMHDLSRRCRRTTPLLLAFAALAASAGHAGAQRRTRFGSDRERIDTTFAFDKSGSVTLTATSGDIIVTGAADARIHVIATSENGSLSLDASPNRVLLQNRAGESHYEVAVPYGVQVIARSQSGDMRIRDTRGAVEAHASSGDLEIEGVNGHLDVNTLSGSITARDVTGDADLVTTSGDVKIFNLLGNADVGTVSGDVELRNVTGKTMRAKTTSGDVRFDGLIDAAGRYDFAAHSGDVEMHFQRDASAQLTISTWNGGVTSDFPITLRPGDHAIGSSMGKRYTFEIGGGGARITAETFSGDVTIAANGHGAAPRR